MVILFADLSFSLFLLFLWSLDLALRARVRACRVPEPRCSADAFERRDPPVCGRSSWLDALPGLSVPLALQPRVAAAEAQQRRAGLLRARQRERLADHDHVVPGAVDRADAAGDGRERIAQVRQAGLVLAEVDLPRSRLLA